MLLTLALLVSPAWGCGGQDLEVTTQVKTGGIGHGPGPTPVAVFGVLRDGRMSSKAWDDISPKLAAVLGSEPCPALFGVDLEAGQGDLAQALDRYARNYGITDAVLDQVGPASQGDLLLALVVAGGTPKAHAPGSGSGPSAQGPRPYRGQRGSIGARPRPRVDHAGLEMSALLFSKTRHEIVASVALRFSGQDINEAYAGLSGKLHELVPGAVCGGWDLASHPVDSDAVQNLPEP